MRFSAGISLILASLGVADAVSSFSPARPPAIPLAVKSPYLTTWQAAGGDSGNGGYLPGQWPSFWNGKATGWTGLVRIDGTVYNWMGAAQLPSNVVQADQTSFTYTATSSEFVLTAGNVTVTATFLSPVTPEDLMRQSLIFSYLNVEVSATDNAAHSIQLYTDITAEWISGDRTNIAQWNYGTTGNNTNYHQIYRQTQQEFSEVADQAEWGNWYYATSNSTSVTQQSGADVDVRGQFVANGTLSNTVDTNYRAIDDNFPVFAFAKDFGYVNGSASTLFTIGLCQEQAVQFDGAQGNVSVPALWTTYFSSDTDALDFFHGDFATAQTTAQSMDSKIASDSAAAAGNDYTTITSLAYRQAFAALTLTNTQEQPLYFLKEISSDGNCNSIDVIFPTHPVLLYSNPAMVKYILEPLLINQASGHYPNTYAMHDLGAHFPNATGHEDGNDEYMPVESCGDSILLMASYYSKTQDAAFLSTYYKLVKQWAGYLIEDSLMPGNQVSTDDFAGPLANQTNLVLKGIIGIRAAAEIANITGNMADAANFSSIADNYINQWYTLGNADGANPAHTTLNYGNTTSWGLLYNLWADTLLGYGLVKEEIYTQQASFYETVFQKYGIPLDTRHTWTKLDWEIFVAAISGSSATRSQMVSSVATWINETTTNFPLTDLYDAVSGNYPDYPNGTVFADRPVVGGVFAMLVAKN